MVQWRTPQINASRWRAREIRPYTTSDCPRHSIFIFKCETVRHHSHWWLSFLNNIMQWSWAVCFYCNSPTWSWISSATPGTLYSSPRDWFIRSSITRRWVSTWGQRSKVNELFIFFKIQLTHSVLNFTGFNQQLRYKKLSKLACSLWPT